MNCIIVNVQKTDQTTFFYIKPLRIYIGCSFWYVAVPVDVNTLRNVVKNLCKMTGFKGYFTNHSLRYHGLHISLERKSQRFADSEVDSCRNVIMST